VLYIVAVDKPEILIERVSNRVREGGHHVPTEKILSRYPRTLMHLAKALQLADVAFLYDSENIQQNGLQHIATCRDGVLIEGVGAFPAWARLVLNR
jgi:predicted ABC-type ATPase